MARRRPPELDDRQTERADEAELAARLKRLGDRLDAISPPQEARRETDDAPAPSAAGYARAMRLSGEFIGGIVAGALLGWVIDWLIGISPWGMIVFLLLGFVAGVFNVMRAAGLMAQPGVNDKN